MDRKYLSIEELNEICENTKMKVADQILDVGTNRYCPNCGESYYMENYSRSTAMYFPPIYKDGVNINPDRNIHTTYCTCMNCGKEFSYNSNGEINTIDFIDRCDAKVTFIDFSDEDVKNLFT